MSVITVGQRRTTGMTGFDVGLVSRAGMGQDDYSSLVPGASVDPTQFYNLPSEDVSTATAPVIFDLGQAYGGSGINTGMTPSTSSSLNLQSLLQPLANAAAFLGTSFGASQLKPGQSIASGGTTVAANGVPLSSFSTGVSSYLPLLLLIGGGVLVVSMLKR